jgi:glycosyltransferase involved in cell wall biosynthesis
MRILICAVEAPLPPINGFRLMLTALTKELRREHEVRVLAFEAPDQKADTADETMRLVPRPEADRLGDVLALARGVAFGRPLRADQLAASLTDPLHAELGEFQPDVVHATSGRLAGLGRLLTGRPSVLAALDAMHVNVEARALVATGLRRRLLRTEVGRVRRFEAGEYGRFGRVVVVSDADRAALLEVNPSLEITVIPNGVDVQFYTPDPGSSQDPKRIVFTGVMSYAPNVLAAEFLAREVFTRIRSERPDARLAIVGRTPAPRVSALAGLDGVQVTGEVPDVRPWLTGSRVYACPMISGTGIKNKLLEAMACGVPCVATPRALQGLHVSGGRHVLVGTSAEELARELTRVLDDDKTARSLGQAAREYVLSEHDWRAAARRYTRVYEEVQANRSRAS